VLQTEVFECISVLIQELQDSRRFESGEAEWSECKSEKLVSFGNAALLP